MTPIGVRGPRPRRSFDSWQIIYIDLMTNIMIFFVILWAIQNRHNNGVSDTFGSETVKMVSLPGDVLFGAGKSTLSDAGKLVLGKLFKDDTGTVLNFESSPLTRRELVIHGHTDADGEKMQNLELGYQRAVAALKEIEGYGSQTRDHVVICTHADNDPEEEVPAFGDKLTAAERNAISDAKGKNRRITIEDKVVGIKPKQAAR